MNPMDIDLNVLHLLLGVLVGYMIGSRIGMRAVAKAEERRESILALFAHKDQVSNEEVQTSLGISEATAIRYLNELEKYGSIAQTGHDGAYITYRRR